METEINALRRIEWEAIEIIALPPSLFRNLACINRFIPMNISNYFRKAKD